MRHEFPQPLHTRGRRIFWERAEMFRSNYIRQFKSDCGARLSDFEHPKTTKVSGKLRHRNLESADQNDSHASIEIEYNWWRI